MEIPGGRVKATSTPGCLGVLDAHSDAGAFADLGPFRVWPRSCLLDGLCNAAKLVDVL
jgi:hypothetical protein